MSGRIEKIEDVKVAMDYFTSLAAIAADALDGKPLNKACAERGITPQTFNHIIHSRIPSYTSKGDKKPEEKLDLKHFLSWQELLWMDIFDEKNPYNIPPSVDEDVKLALNDKYITSRERTIIFMRYAERMTLDQVGAHFHVTRDRIRQIEAKALRKLRNPRRSHQMRYGKAVREKTDELQRVRNALAISDKMKALEDQIDKAIEANDIQMMRAYRDVLNDKLAELNSENDPGDVNNVALEDLELSMRSYNCLKRWGIKTLGDLTKMTEYDLMKVRNLGRKSYNEVVGRMHDYGVGLIPSEVEV